MTSRPSLLLPAQAAKPEAGGLRRARDWFLGRWIGRVVLVCLAVRLLELVGLRLPDGIDIVIWLILTPFYFWAAWKVFRWLVRRWLWRIRTKLIVSYLFVAMVPVVLLTVFFTLAGLLLSGLIAAYMVSSEVDKKAEELGRLSDTALATLTAAPSVTPAMVEQVVGPVRAAYPEVLYAYVRNGTVVAATPPLVAELPGWLGDKPFAGLARLPSESTVRAVSRHGRSWLLIDVPLDKRVFTELEKRTDIRLLTAGGSVRSKRGGGIDVDIKDDEHPNGKDAKVPGLRPERESPKSLTGLPLITTPDQTVWATGAKDAVAVVFQYDPRVVVRRLSPGSLNVTDWLFSALAWVGGAFLVVYALALMVGVLLARSVTRSVHALHRGTERLRQGQFDQPIPVRSRDQLGELAESFNLMSRDIQQLMRESAEKERLEEELRIARRIQMSLLPQSTVEVPHLDIAATCIPATEVGGDYYDLLPLPGDRLAVLVADVSGKGTSAALYMAELKGLMLSLSRVHESPAALLAEANRILAGDIDSRSFITMCYAVLEPRARRMRYARAGHSPLIQFQKAAGLTRLLAPPGLGLGLDRGTRFEEVLKEEELPLLPGDVFLFFTDGISEAMNPRGELFGEDRLRALLERDPGAAADQIRERVLDEVRVFQGAAPQHDDMTMVVLRVE